VPKTVRALLKPWQFDGLRHLWHALIADHEPAVRATVRVDERARNAEARGNSAAAGEEGGQEGGQQGDAVESQGTEQDEGNPNPAGSILAHTMGAGKTLQVRHVPDAVVHIADGNVWQCFARCAHGERVGGRASSRALRPLPAAQRLRAR
jgi:hypothetical protein